MKRLLTAFVVLIVLAATWVTAAHARAGGIVDLTCQGTQSIEYQPGLLLTPNKVTFTATDTFGSCASLLDPSIHSGTYTSTGDATLSCLNVGPGSGTKTFRWDNDRTSTFTYTLSVYQLLGQSVVVLTGTITSGEFIGDSALQIVTIASLQFSGCLAPPGVMTAKGTSTLLVTGT